jgi:tetratricopeptide (TPR) repeat protein
MLAKYKKIGVVVLTGALLAALGSPSEVWARGGGRGGGGENRGGDRGYNGGDRGGYNAGDRGANVAAGRTNNVNANAGFGARNFSSNNNWNGAANGNRLGADANLYRADAAIGPYGAGYGGLGYGALGAGVGYGAGYPLFGMYGAGGYGGGYGSTGYGNAAGNYNATDTSYSSAPVTTLNSTVPTNGQAPTDDQVTTAGQFDAKGSADFKAGNYQAAVQDWQHVLIDMPHNGGAMLLVGQGLFATGQYQSSAGAVQLGMQMLPEDQWGNVIKHYTDLYPNNKAYTEQLRALETARTANPNDPALRFLLGYQYGYLGYPTQAIKEFDKAINLRPQDRGAVVMRNLFAEKAGVAALPLPPLPTSTAAPTAQPVSKINPAS